MKVLVLFMAALLLVLGGCRLNGVLTKEEAADEYIGYTISKGSDFMHRVSEAGVKVRDDKSYVMPNGHRVIAVDHCYVPCVPWTRKYDCIIFAEVDESGIVVNAWPDPNSWKERPKEERGTIHDTADPDACTPKALLGPFYDR